MSITFNAISRSIMRFFKSKQKIAPLPGSKGERNLQRRFGTLNKATSFYNKQMLPYLAPRMMSFIEEQDMFFISTADAHGECDCSPRFGDKGFVTVLDSNTLIFPDFRGQGVMAGAGNIIENGHIGMLFMDYSRPIGLHVNGKADIIFKEKLSRRYPKPVVRRIQNNIFVEKTDFYVLVTVEEGFIHCAKHIPLMEKVDRKRSWGTDDVIKKGGDAFEVKDLPRPWMKKKVEH